MKCIIPEISWHNRDPVLSVDFQPKTSNKDQIRLATAGTDTHVLIWYVSPSATGGVILEVAADLARHQKAVNVVRWSPSGVYLASGDDESIIFIWNQRTDKDPPPIFEETNEQDRETWVVYKTLRGHVEDVYDISWNSSSTNLVSGSVDNKIIFWDLHKGRSTSIVSDHKGFVQGVSWDPKDQYIATLSSDRVFRVFDVKTKKVVSRSSKAVLPVPSSHPLHNQTMRLYYDDTLQSFFRRLQFSPDGLLIAAPSGYIEPDQNRQLKAIHGVYIYTRYSLKVPACILPCGDSPALAVRWSPLIYDLRKDGPKPAFGLESRRMILAVATKAAVLLYDTQQKSPLAVISNIHYTRLTDLTWSSDGKIVVVSSTDGFCSVIYFSDKELGEVHVEPIIEQMEVENVSSEVNQLIPKQFKIPIEKNNKSDTIVIEDDIESPAVEKRQISVDMMDEIAMEPWSDDSQNACKPTAPTLVEEASTDIKLVYEESQSSQVVEKKPSPKLVNEVISQAASPTVNSSPKPGRRLTFVTLSSPKNKKKVK